MWSGPVLRAHALGCAACVWLKCEVMGRGEMHVGLVGVGRERYVWIVTGAKSKVNGPPSINSGGCLNLCDASTLQSHGRLALKGRLEARKTQRGQQISTTFNTNTRAVQMNVMNLHEKTTRCVEGRCRGFSQ